MQGGSSEKHQRAPPLLAAARALPKKEMKQPATARIVPKVAEPPKPKDGPKQRGKADQRQKALQAKLNRTAILDQGKPTRSRSKMQNSHSLPAQKRTVSTTNKAQHTINAPDHSDPQTTASSGARCYTPTGPTPGVGESRDPSPAGGKKTASPARRGAQAAQGSASTPGPAGWTELHRRWKKKKLNSNEPVPDVHTVQHEVRVRGQQRPCMSGRRD